MKDKLLLYLSNIHFSGNTTIIPTLAWLSKSKNYLFDNYLDSYHLGIHFPGGDSRSLELGQLTGGTVSGDRHFEEFYFLLHNFDVSIVIVDDSIFLSCLENFSIPFLRLSHQTNILYKTVFNFLNFPLPLDIIMIGSDFKRELSGIGAYLYPEIFYRKGIGVLDSIPEDELEDLYQQGSKIFCFYVRDSIISRLQKSGYNIEVVDRLNESDCYLSITKRIALRWKEKAKGWILGDPTLVSHWLPKTCEEGLLPLYSIPQEKIVSQIGDLISSKGNIVYGRQYSDRDFFELSKLNQCFQVIDPCRPPFQSIRHVDYIWNNTSDEVGFYDPEYSDEELTKFASEGKILISLMFWSGMIREIANFYNLMDLFSLTGLKCGLVLTAQSYEYMMHSPFELLTIPLDQGGVYPLVEPVLGSCGIGVGIESYIKKDRLQETLHQSLSRILTKVKSNKYLPRGWWTTMDANLEKLPRVRGPKPFRFLPYSPYFQIRYTQKEDDYSDISNPANGGTTYIPKNRFKERLKHAILKAGLMKHFEKYRPYEAYQAGPIKRSVIDAAKFSGLQYMFTKSGFKSDPEPKYIDDQFIALNYTSGQWDGWTPFETINDVSDLIKSEKMLHKSRRPGWIVSTIDSCLWTFSGEFWKTGNRLFEIANFCCAGGKSKKLVNVKPYTISRYARLIADKNN